MWRQCHSLYSRSSSHQPLSWGGLVMTKTLQFLLSHARLRELSRIERGKLHQIFYIPKKIVDASIISKVLLDFLHLTRRKIFDCPSPLLWVLEDLRHTPQAITCCKPPNFTVISILRDFKRRFGCSWKPTCPHRPSFNPHPILDVIYLRTAIGYLNAQRSLHDDEPQTSAK